jgi:hypothetical protein
LRRRAIGVQVNSIEATVNSILREWRDLWPGGLREEEYSTLNLMALCRQGPLGYNLARCQDCRHREWYASSCGNRHCPNCLGPRQAEWSEKVCGRLPDCAHFHVVFTVPEELHDFFEMNYLARYTSRIAMSNQRIKRVDEVERTVSFDYKDYRDEGRTKEMTMSGAAFLWSFARHLVPKSFRRVRYFGLLAGAKGRHRELAGAPQSAIGEKTPERPRPACQKCGGCHWKYMRWRHCLERAAQSTPGIAPRLAAVGENRFSLYPPDSG